MGLDRCGVNSIPWIHPPPHHYCTACFTLHTVGGSGHNVAMVHVRLNPEKSLFYLRVGRILICTGGWTAGELPWFHVTWVFCHSAEAACHGEHDAYSPQVSYSFNTFHGVALYCNQLICSSPCWLFGASAPLCSRIRQQNSTSCFLFILQLLCQNLNLLRTCLHGAKPVGLSNWHSSTARVKRNVIGLKTHEESLQESNWDKLDKKTWQNWWM